MNKEPDAAQEKSSQAIKDLTGPNESSIERFKAQSSLESLIKNETIIIPDNDGDSNVGVTPQPSNPQKPATAHKDAAQEKPSQASEDLTRPNMSSTKKFINATWVKQYNITSRPGEDDDGDGEARPKVTPRSRNIQKLATVTTPEALITPFQEKKHDIFASKMFIKNKNIYRHKIDGEYKIKMEEGRTSEVDG